MSRKISNANWTTLIKRMLVEPEGPYTVAEIANRLGCPTTTVNSCLNSLRNREVANNRKLRDDERLDLKKRNMVWELNQTHHAKIKKEIVRKAKEQAEEPVQAPVGVRPEKCPTCRAPGNRMLCSGSGARMVQIPSPMPGHAHDYWTHEICPFRAALKIRQNMDPSIRDVPPYDTPTPLLREESRFLYFARSWFVVARNTQNFILNQPDPMHYTSRITSDREILEVRLGEQTTENGERLSLSQFMLPYDLVVIRLGELGYENRAAGGYLFEAIIGRIRANARTWVVIPPSMPYDPGHFAYDAQLDHLFDVTFNKSVKLKSDSLDRKGPIA